MMPYDKCAAARRSLTALAMLVGAAGCAVTDRADPAPLPLGAATLPQQESVERVAAGVTYRRLLRGAPALDAPWFISTGVAWTSADVARGSHCIARLGLTPAQRRYSAPGVTKRPYRVVVGGAFATRAAAAAALAAQPSGSCVYAIQSLSDEPGHGVGPWSLHILEIDPRAYHGGWRIVSAQDGVGGVAATSAIAARAGALAAINGGYFVMDAADGVVGDPIGLTIIAGRVLSEATRGQPLLLLHDTRPIAASVIEPAAAPVPALRWADGTATPLDGINRRPGLIRDCGQLAGTVANDAGGGLGFGAAAAPAHDRTCTNAHELIAVTAVARFDPAVDGAEIWWLRSDGTLAPVAAGPPPAGGVRIVATGRRRAELRAKAAAGRARLDLGGAALGTADHLHVLNGGPTLLRRGRLVRRDRTEGWEISPALGAARATLIHNWSVRRNPRTAFGITADGRLLLLVADGRGAAQTPGRDRPLGVGLTIEELRRVMRHLGAVEAINLDGGGSSTLVIGSTVRNLPSDGGAERPVANALVLTP